MQVRPVINDSMTVVAAVAELAGQPLSLRGELDVDVYRLHGHDAGPDLVARVFGPGVARATVETAARVLQSLADTRFPAERCPVADPVLALGDDCHALVTEYVEPSPAPSPGFVLAWCAGLLGRLAVRLAETLPAGGGWHRLGATPSIEIDQACARWPCRNFSRRARRCPGRSRRRQRLARGADPRRPHAIERGPSGGPTPRNHRLDRGGAGAENMGTRAPLICGRSPWCSPGAGALRGLGPIDRGGTRSAAGGDDRPSFDA